MRRLLLAAAIAVLSLLATACDDTADGILEDSGENLDEVQQQVDEAGDDG